MPYPHGCIEVEPGILWVQVRGAFGNVSLTPADLQEAKDVLYRFVGAFDDWNLGQNVGMKIDPLIECLRNDLTFSSLFDSP